MRSLYIGIIAVVLVMAAIAFAGCASSSPPPQTGGGAKATGTTAAGSSGSSSGSSGGSSSGATGSGLFSGLSYNWVEYKIDAGSAAQGMTMYIKFYKTGQCTLRFEGPAAAQMPSGGTMDCSSSGGQKQNNPNAIASDAQISCSPLPESVTVPAGTFSATKCTVTSKGSASTMWVAAGKAIVKVQGTSPEGQSYSMVLNSSG